jgi:hypothetical protein
MKKTSEKLARSLANADVLVWKKERKKWSKKLARSLANADVRVWKKENGK